MPTLRNLAAVTVVMYFAPSGKVMMSFGSTIFFDYMFNQVLGGTVLLDRNCSSAVLLDSARRNPSFPSDRTRRGSYRGRSTPEYSLPGFALFEIAPAHSVELRAMPPI